MPLDILYPKIEFPVSKGSASLSSLIKWDHAENWYVSTFEENKIDSTGELETFVTLQEDSFKFLRGNRIDGKVFIPSSFFLQLVVDFFAKIKNIDQQQLNIQFEDVKLLRHFHLIESDKIFLNVMIQPGSGKFSITESKSEIMSGIIQSIEEPNVPAKKNTDIINLNSKITLSKDDVYKELKLRGHNYSDLFKTVVEAREDCMGKIKWNNNLTTFLDGIFQINYLKTDSRDPMMPSKIRKLTIFGRHHEQLTSHNSIVNVDYDSKFDRIAAGGFELYGLECNHLDRRIITENLILERYEFLPHFPSPVLTTFEALRCCIQLAIENSVKLKMKILELDSDYFEAISLKFNYAMETISSATGKCTFLTDKDISLPGIQVEEGELSAHSNCTFIIAAEVLQNLNFANKIKKSLDEISFLISKENLNINLSVLTPPPGYNIIAVFTTRDKYLVLLQKIKTKLVAKPTVIKISEQDTKYLWIKETQAALNKGPVLLYAVNEKYSGILGMVNSLRRDVDNELVSCFIIDDENAPKFDAESSFYRNQLNLGLSVNVFKNVGINISFTKDDFF